MTHCSIILTACYAIVVYLELGYDSDVRGGILIVLIYTTDLIEYCKCTFQVLF